MSEPTTQQPELVYGEVEARGIQRQHWIENAPTDSEVSCPIEPCTFNLADLDPAFQNTGGPNYCPEETMSVTQDVMGVRAPPSDTWRRFDLLKVDPDAEPVQDATLWHLHNWEGNIAPGILYIENIFRRAGASFEEAGPRSSQLSQAIYESRHPIDTLKHIIFCDVVNKETKRFVKRQLYDDALFDETGVEWPSDELLAWEYNTPAYRGILGTPIGAVASWIVLGAFKRGTHRIGRIYTCGHYGRCMLIRFDIEAVEPVIEPTKPKKKSDKKGKPEKPKGKSEKKRKVDNADDELTEAVEFRKSKREKPKGKPEKKRKVDDADDELTDAVEVKKRKKL
ncbi:hypothetical protein N7466_003495 [Penicillium verhagenii]|uniref:uncharacterized protein n=1 Tax=Penicillium verhagenii TaxID=1562060 RepID=UPI002544EA6C|nr:uncharacterized protein N7466_003495 [Penicillium verhagenii]KAJ5937045.1 hypothetical protein N7466_003495 [Penicillium verhagenii]